MNPSTQKTEPVAQTEPKPPPRRRWLRVLGLVLLWPVLALLTLWCFGALALDVRYAWLRMPLAVLYGTSMLGVLIFVKPRKRAAATCVGGFVIVLAWWFSLKPSNTRDWQPDLAVLAYADINGNQVTVHNIRNCDYRTETDFDVRYYDKTFDLEKLRTADLYLVTWGSPNIAHTMVSFGFEGGDYLCFSIETRKQKGQGYSAIRGLYRQFELTYIVADERDLVRLRTNYRQGEEACLYRVRATPEKVRKLFLAYLGRANHLHEQPEWYNAVTDNCTTGIRAQRAASDRQPWNWRMLINGHLDELLYERGAVATNLPFAELKERAHINATARKADKDPEFSKHIRENLPLP